jgi:hypothetical protein
MVYFYERIVADVKYYINDLQSQLSILNMEQLLKISKEIRKI